MRKGGRIVETESGKGRTNNGSLLINGKIPVELIDDEYVPTGKKILCDPKKIRTIGFWN
jgi:hypothetical protein